MFYAGAALTAILGLIFGSFASALSYRVPRGISIVGQARSQCPSCKTNLGLIDLVPLLSWICLKGKCRHCGARIGLRYPLIELATLLLCLLFFAVYGLTAQTAFLFALAPVLISIIDIDLWDQIIPDCLNLAVFLLGVAALGVNTGLSLHPEAFFLAHGLPALAGSLIFGGGAWALRYGGSFVLKREAMGMGDVKFFTAAGFWIGANVAAVSVLMIVSGAAGILLALLWKKRTGAAEVPFGPSLVIAFIIVLCLFPPPFLTL